ncbi:carbohydrate kinase family protein [Pseudonocardia charpentierae]|uniref:Carbohydrate kinase family protein n=1 Tax=Pseudonocardia charpentierae TaxID=3075545 RepID=A0ABU2N300_9PSEU|nr:carbohydrate kinase family protein [Pseudonocardia sp. DSM 45834]MDT0348121.1 carbohydrate kinase family protein [Pseudonocardia sp. DSM 45834]
MAGLGVIGNISRDLTEYPGRPRRHLLGGAALYVALAAARAGMRAAPISVIGADLAAAMRTPLLEPLDLSGVAVTAKPSCRFSLRYSREHVLIDFAEEYGAAEDLTRHALVEAPRHEFVHVCCRRPLDPVPVLTALVDRRQRFSVDFVAASAADMIAATAALLPRADVVFTDAKEYDVLLRTVGASDLPAVTVTDGPGPVTLYEYGVLVARAPVRRVEAVEVTGAGDTFSGTFLASVLDGQSRRRALRRAVKAATARVTVAGIVLGG